MALTTGELRIANLALAHIGQKPLASTTVEGTQTSKQSVCEQFYPEARNDVLADYDWNCAATRVEIAADAEAPVFGFSYRHALPSDCLAVREVVGLDREQWSVESGYILSDTTPLQVRYTTENIAADALSQFLINIVAIKLAFYIAPILKTNSQESQLLYQLYNQEYLRARMLDASENVSRTKDESDWEEAYD